MDEWALLETAAWRGIRQRRAEVADGLARLAAQDPFVATFRIRDGEVTLVDLPAAQGDASFAGRRAMLTAQLLRLALPDDLDCDLLLGVRMADRGAEAPQVPLFCFHKRRFDPGILLPDLDFIIHDFYAAGDFRDHRVFADKQARASFVGATTGGPVTRERVADGSHERIRAARFFADRPDVRFEISDVVQCPDESFRRAVEQMVPRASAHRSWREQFGFRYLIVMDGNGASWSRTAVVLASASAPIRYASPWLLFYSHGLQPWIHYLPVRRDEEVLALVGDSARTMQRDAAIADAGRDFARRHLTRDAVLQYCSALLRRYAALFAG